MEIANYAAAILPLLAMLVMLLLGIPLAISIGSAAFLGFVLLTGTDAAVSRVGSVAYRQIMHYAFSPLVLFIFMGEIIAFTGLGSGVFEATSKWIGRVPGSLAVGSVFASAIFGAICGVSVAGAATIGTVAIPEMRKRGYVNSLATGVIAAGGTLSIMIPPSVAFVLYGIIAEESIGALFIAGIIPGVILTTLFAVYCIGYGVTHPQNAPPTPVAPLRERLVSLKTMLPVAALFFIVLGSIYLGLGTPTEAGGLGAAGALLIAFALRNLNPRNLWKAAFTTAITTGTFMIIFLGAIFFGYFLGTSGYTERLVTAVTGLQVEPWVIVIFMAVLLFILGMFMDVGSIIFLTTPILLPVAKSLGFDPIWYGVFLVLMCEMAAISPPVAMNIFVIQGIAPDIPIRDIYKGIVPFLIMDWVMLGILLTVPAVATWLPSLMRSGG